MSQNLDAPLSPDNQLSSILEEAKKEVKKMNKKVKKKQKTRHE